jgi:hypothetical protein
MDPKLVALYGQIVTSILTLIALFGCLIVSFLLRDNQLELLVVGAVIAMATTVVNYWLGSSSGSQKKDDIMAAQAAAGSRETGRPSP